jgi:hypothetical protein
LTIEQLRTILPTLISYLAPSAFVVYTYAAVTLERLLLLKREEGLVLTKNNLAPLLQNLLAALFGLIERDTSPEKLAENDFLMRCMSQKDGADFRFDESDDCKSRYLGTLSPSFYTTSPWHSR